MAGQAAPLADTFLERLSTLLDDLRRSQLAAIGEAAELCAAAIAGGGLIHVFGSGHSSIVCQDLFARAGGFIPVNWIVGMDLLPLHGLRSGAIERVSGLADALIDAEPIAPGDVLIVVSNSGRNAVPVEMAEAARERGLRTVAITSLSHSRSVTSRAPSGRRLFEVVDVVVDNLAVSGDAALSVGSGTETVSVGATSTIVGAAALQAIAVETAARLVERGVRPPIFMSANLDGGDSHNEAVLRAMGPRVPSLLAADIDRMRGR